MRFGCGPGIKECLGYRHFFEEGDRENLEQSVEGGIEGEALLNDGDQDVDGNRDPYLRPNRVVRRAVELFDPQNAVAAYREALKEYTRERVPLDWAMTQMNLGNALFSLGARESGTDRLNEAVAAYREALKERTRERVPLDWAMTQMNLGNALSRLGERESGTDRLNEAVAAYREALKERTRERVPRDWAMTQNNVCFALSKLGERENDTARLNEAITACRDALKEQTREQVPLDWAMTQDSLGYALRALGEREGGTARLDEAVAAYRAALKVFTSGHAQDVTQKNLDAALKLLEERKRQTQRELGDGCSGRPT